MAPRMGVPRSCLWQAVLGVCPRSGVIYLVNHESKVEKRWVTKMGVLRNGLREIETKPKLLAAEKVIVEGLQRVRTGDKVQPKSEQTKDAAAKAAEPESVNPEEANPKAGVGPSEKTPAPRSEANRDSGRLPASR